MSNSALRRIGGQLGAASHGNIEKSIFIRTSLLNRVDLTKEKRNSIKFELAKDYFESGLLDKSKILLAGKNFGCGSSREHAPWALSDFGIKSVISSSFADIFYNNCFKNSVLPIKLSKEQINHLFEVSNFAPVSFEIDLLKKYPKSKRNLDEREKKTETFKFQSTNRTTILSRDFTKNTKIRNRRI